MFTSTAYRTSQMKSFHGHEQNIWNQAWQVVDLISSPEHMQYTANSGISVESLLESLLVGIEQGCFVGAFFCAARQGLEV